MHSDAGCYGVSIGYFRLWPRTTKAFDLVECIVQINTSERNPFLPALREKGLCEVAAWEAEPICVATKKSAYLEGTVVKISRAQASVKGVFLANNFETFLLIAGNLDSIRDKHSNTGDTISALAEFERCLDYFALSPEGISAWKSISEVVLSH